MWLRARWKHGSCKYACGGWQIIVSAPKFSFVCCYISAASSETVLLCRREKLTILDVSSVLMAGFCALLGEDLCRWMQKGDLRCRRATSCVFRARELRLVFTILLCTCTVTSVLSLGLQNQYLLSGFLGKKFASLCIRIVSLKLQSAPASPGGLIKTRGAEQLHLESFCFSRCRMELEYLLID